MPWHTVVIRNTETARWAAVPPNAVVHHGLNATRDHVYYFSPAASTIALATQAFQTFEVHLCPEQPNLDGFERVTLR